MKRGDDISSRDTPSTNPSIFLRLNAVDAKPRQVAWEEFNDRYGPIIHAFAQKLGVRGQEVDDVVQDVMIGFFGKAPTFVYDPTRGRFRGYLKTCTFHAMVKRRDRHAKIRSVPVEALNEHAEEVEQAWNDAWDKWQFERALTEIRDEVGPEDTGWQAFEQNVIHGRSPQEIADELELTLSAIYKARERVRKALRQKLLQLQEDEG